RVEQHVVHQLDLDFELRIAATLGIVQLANQINHGRLHDSINGQLARARKLSAVVVAMEISVTTGDAGALAAIRARSKAVRKTIVPRQSERYALDHNVQVYASHRWRRATMQDVSRTGM